MSVRQKSGAPPRQPKKALSDADLARQALREVAADKDASASARAQAARTLAEMAGVIGRNSEPPPRTDKPVSEMTLEELEQALKDA